MEAVKEMMTNIFRNLKQPIKLAEDCAGYGPGLAVITKSWKVPCDPVWASELNPKCQAYLRQHGHSVVLPDMNDRQFVAGGFVATDGQNPQVWPRGLVGFVLGRDILQTMDTQRLSHWLEAC